jgi:nucleotide-binding universal stress UspA family protein
LIIDPANKKEVDEAIKSGSTLTDEALNCPNNVIGQEAVELYNLVEIVKSKINYNEFKFMTTSNSLFSRILVAVDRSDCAMKAFEYAIQLARVINAKVFVVHVVQNPAVTADALVSVSELKTSFKKQGRELLTSLSSIAEAKFGTKVETILEEGDPQKAILDTAKKSDANMIVIGSRGLSQIKELLLGSVSHSITKHANIPVLIVK